MAGNLLSQWNFKIPELPFDSWWLLGVVLVVLMLAIWLIARLTASLNDDIDPAEIDRQMLTTVSDLHRQGELSPGEYRSIKGRLVERMSDQSLAADSDGSAHNGQPEKETKAQSLNTTEDPLGSSNFESSPEGHANGTVKDSQDTSEDKTDSSLQ